MKKLLGSTLALAMFVPTGANAELWKNLKLSGQLDVQTTSARNIADFVTRPTGANSSPASANNNDRTGNAHTRVMLSADWDLLDDVHARVTLVKGGEQGTVATSRLYGQAGQNLQAVSDTVIVQEANVKIDKLASLFDTTIGRQFYGEPGDLIAYYGPRDNYGLNTSALDAFRFDWKGEHMMVTGVAGRMTTPTASTLSTNADSTVDVRGLIASCNQHEMVKPSLYIYNRVTHATGGLGNTSGSTGFNGANATSGKNDNLWVFGAKAKIAAGGLTAHVEGAINRGEDRTTFVNTGGAARNVSYNGYALLGKVGYKAEVQDVAAVNPWAEFGLGSGDSNFDYKGNKNFQSINTDYRPGGIYGRFDQASAEVLNNADTSGSNGSPASNGLSNRVIWGLGVKATPAAINKLTAGLAFYRYAFHRVAPSGAAGLKPSRNIGSEVDVTAEWKHSDNVSLNITLGSFLPGAFIADQRNPNAALNPAQMAAADVKIRF